MKKDRQIITTSCRREFATFPVAVLAFVMNRKKEFLLLKRPSESRWEVPSGALELGESPVQGLVRELREELGDAFRHRILGPVHATSFRFDDNVTNMLSLGFAVQHSGGHVIPGDDMSGAQCLWLSVESIRKRRDISVPSDLELFSRARDICRIGIQGVDCATKSSSVRRAAARQD
jgi:ADP-ribose pyrophosphatase YjhB (NUDIX family)